MFVDPEQLKRAQVAAFTIRRNLIRVISVRDTNRREQEFYARHEETNS
jgi:uncharacterized DUF497 family protein